MRARVGLRSLRTRGAIASLVLWALVASCAGCRDDATGDPASEGEPSPKLSRVSRGPLGDVVDPPVNEPFGVLGGACDVDGDCITDGAVCLSDGFPRGACTLPCDGVCSEQEGQAPSFCAASHQLPSGVQWIGEGACVGSCDYGAWPTTGCRAGYGCVPLEQALAPTQVRYACLPGVGIELDGPRKLLAGLGVGFTPVEHPDSVPQELPYLTCSVTDAVELRSPLLGLELASFDGKETPVVLASAEMALALADAAKELRALGVKKLLHLGTFNCRPIRGTQQLSRHGQANAIDVFGFELDDGTRYTVKKHWQKKPKTKGAKLIAAAVDRLVGTGRWKVVLTPAYNKDHEDHLHLDVVTDEADPAAFLKRWPKSLAD